VWDDRFDEEFVGIASFFPLATLAASAPLIAMRSLRGWSLTLSDEVEIPRDTPNVEDLFLLSIVVASCVTLTRWMIELMPGPPEGAQYVMLGMIMIMSLVIVLPAVATTFLTRTWPMRLIAWLIMVLVVFVTGLLLNVIPAWWNGSGLDSRLMEDLLLGTVSGSLTAMVGGWALLASGLKLTRFARSAPSSDSPWDQQNAEAVQRPGSRARRHARWLTALAVLAAVLSTAGLSLADYRRLLLYRAMQGAASTGPNSARAILSGGHPVGLQFGSEARDEDVAALMRPSTKQLLLSKTKITDAALANLPERATLTELDAYEYHQRRPGKAIEAAASRETLGGLHPSRLRNGAAHRQSLERTTLGRQRPGHHRSTGTGRD
jgi:hypothetical protein